MPSKSAAITPRPFSQRISRASSTNWLTLECVRACATSGYLPGVVHLHEDGPGGLPDRVQPEVGLGDDAEGPQGAGEQLGEVVAGHVLDDLAAGLRHRAVGEHHFDADDQISHRTVPETPRTRGVRRHDAPDGCALFRGVYAQHLVRPGEALLQVLQLQAGLGAYDLISRNVLDDPVHARGAEDEIHLSRRIPEAHLRTAAARRDGEPLAARELHYLARLFDRAGLDDEGGFHAVYGVVGRGLPDVLLADYVLQLFRG